MLDRIASLASTYWSVAFCATLLTTIVIASGDCGSRARHLLPALPVSARAAYASKICATTIVLTVFVGLALAFESAAPTMNAREYQLFAGALALGLIWAFAAPLFVRGFVGAFVVTIAVPSLLLTACIPSARFLAELALQRALVGLDLARWCVGDEFADSGQLSLSWRPIREAAETCSYAAVIAVGLLAAWNARSSALCRRSPGGLSRARFLRFAVVSILCLSAATVATAIRTWNTDATISKAVETARAYDLLRVLPTAELVETFVGGRAQIASPAPLPNGTMTPVWHTVLNASEPYASTASTLQQRFDRALFAVLHDRGKSDPTALAEALRSVVADTEGRTLGMRLAAARRIGPYTHTMVALRGLARATDDNERAALILALSLNSHIFGPEQPRTTYEEFLSPDRTLSWGFVGWDLLPYKIRDFETDEYLRSVEGRVSAVLLLASFERQLRNGTLRLQNEYRSDDWLEVDAATLRKARAAVERPLGDLARGANILKPRGGDIALYTDDETLYLRTSELFDREKTDPSYLHPEK